MRALKISLSCLVAFAFGALVAAALVRYPLQIARIYDDVSAVFGTVVTPPSPDAPGWHNGAWTPPTIIPAHSHWAWQTTDGKTYQDVVITGITSTDVAITHAQGIAHVPLDLLPHDIQHELQYNPADNGKPVAPPVTALTPVSSMLDNKLVDSRGHALATPPGTIKFYAVYYSAGWCAPCHAFTSSLVDWYQKFKPFHHNFELVFVSEDKSEVEMYSYMVEMKMPWPAMRYSELTRSPGTFIGPGIQQFAHEGIPDLVLLDSSGKVISDSFNGSTYLGPQSVVDYMNSNLSLN